MSIVKIPPQHRSTASLGTIPGRLVSADGSLSADLGEEAPTPSKTADLIKETLDQAGVALASPDKDPLLVQSGRRLAQLFTYRVGGDRPLPDVAHPNNAATHLVPAAPRC